MKSILNTIKKIVKLDFKESNEHHVKESIIKRINSLKDNEFTEYFFEKKINLDNVFILIENENYNIDKNTLSEYNYVFEKNEFYNNLINNNIDYLLNNLDFKQNIYYFHLGYDGSCGDDNTYALYLYKIPIKNFILTYYYLNNNRELFDFFIKKLPIVDLNLYEVEKTLENLNKNSNIEKFSLFLKNINTSNIHQVLKHLNKFKNNELLEIEYLDKFLESIISNRFEKMFINIFKNNKKLLHILYQNFPNIINNAEIRDLLLNFRKTPNLQKDLVV